MDEIEEEIKEAPPEKRGVRPDFRIVQPEYDKDGKIVYRDVGGMWKNISKAGNVFYTMRIGKLKLLVFPNEPREELREQI